MTKEVIDKDWKLFIYPRVPEIYSINEALKPPCPWQQHSLSLQQQLKHLSVSVGSNRSSVLRHPPVTQHVQLLQSVSVSVSISAAVLVRKQPAG